MIHCIARSHNTKTCPQILVSDHDWLSQPDYWETQRNASRLGNIGADVLRNQVLNGIVYDYLYHPTLQMSMGKSYTEMEVIPVWCHCVEHYKVGSQEKACMHIDVC